MFKNNLLFNSMNVPCEGCACSMQGSYIQRLKIWEFNHKVISHKNTDYFYCTSCHFLEIPLNLWLKILILDLIQTNNKHS